MKIFGKKREDEKKATPTGTPCEKCGSTNTRQVVIRSLYHGGILGTPQNAVRVRVCRDCGHRSVMITAIEQS